MVPRLRRRRWRMKAKRRLEETRACRAPQAKAGDDVSDGSEPILLSSFIFYLFSLLQFRGIEPHKLQFIKTGSPVFFSFFS
jgi:hypothetical protein